MRQDPFFTGPKEIKRDRSLLELGGVTSQQRVESIENLKVSDEQLATVFDGFAFQINRATVLIREIEKARRNNFVPVDVDAVRVQVAVRRREQGSNGTQISFDLYKAMLDAQVAAARKMSFEIVGELSGELSTDAKKIQRYMKSGGKGLSAWEEFLMNADQWLILFLLDRLTTQFQCEQHKECTVAKEPPFTEDGPILLRNALSVAAMLLILGMKEEHVLYALGNAGNALGIPPVDLINRARRLEKSDLDRALEEMVGVDDPQVIISYVDNYISKSPDGYDDWIAYRDLRYIREDATITYVHAREYSRAHAVLLEYSAKSEVSTPIPGFFGQMAGVQVVQPMFANHYEALNSKLGGIDLAISSIAGTLTYQFALDVICCIARFFSKQDIKSLRKVRRLLAVLQAGLHGQISVGLNLPGSPLDWAAQRILQDLINFVERTFDKAIIDVLGWVNNKSDQTWEALMECPLIADLLAYIVDAIARLRSIFFDLVTKFASNINFSYTGISRRWGVAAEARRVSTIIRVIDEILATFEACATWEDRDRENPNPVPLPDPADNPRLNELNPKRLSIPPEDYELFFKHTGYIKLGETVHPIPPVNHVVTTTDDVTNVRNFRDLCYGILPESLFEQVEKSDEAK